MDDVWMCWDGRCVRVSSIPRVVLCTSYLEITNITRRTRGFNV